MKNSAGWVEIFTFSVIAMREQEKNEKNFWDKVSRFVFVVMLVVGFFFWGFRTFVDWLMFTFWVFAGVFLFLEPLGKREVDRKIGFSLLFIEFAFVCLFLYSDWVWFIVFLFIAAKDAYDAFVVWRKKE